MENIDLECAKLGRELTTVKAVEEQTFNHALNVLEEQGVYACFLYLKAREKVDKSFIDQCHNFLKKMLNLSNQGDILDTIQGISQDLDQLLFARDLLRQAFIYGRYHAKLKESDKGRQ